MSAVCLIDLKKKPCPTYSQLNRLARKLVKLALKYNMGVHINDYGYAPELIESADASCFFFLSESFLFENCDFLTVSEMDVFAPDFPKRFKKKFIFFEKLLNVLGKAGLREVDIYVSEGCNPQTVEDFECEVTDAAHFLDRMCAGIFLDPQTYAYGFPCIRYTVCL